MYPNFDQSFILETDVSVRVLGAVLSQIKEDGQTHQVAFASRALATPEKNYSITDLETLAVVWAVSHFHAYLYGHDVEVRTDHSAVKAVLGTPSPSRKHARWWMKVYSSGVGTVTIIHKACKENYNADALSRNPLNPSPPEGIEEGEMQIAVVRNRYTAESTNTDIADLLSQGPQSDQLTC